MGRAGRDHEAEEAKNMKRACDRAQRRAVRLLDGELAGEERSALEAHVRGCERCRSDLESMRALRGLFSSLPGLPSRPQDRERIRRMAGGPADLRGGAFQPERFRARFDWTDRVTVAAAAACLVLGGLWVRDLREGGRPAPASLEVLTLAEWSARERGVPLAVEGRSIESLLESRGNPSGRSRS